MFSLAYIPPLWFRVMDPRLLEAVQHDPSRINFDPAKREILMKKYALVDGFGT
jgi:alkane 1-monooxygenase